MRTPRVLLVIGSTRPVRVGDQLADELVPILTSAGAHVTVADLAELALPLLDEPRMPALGDYTQQHTHDWSAIVRDADAVVWLTPQYNGGYPAAVKNAVDYLFAEWADKPTLIVSYGGRGGGMGGAQLRSVLEFVRANVASPNVEIVLPREAYGPDGRLQDAASPVATHGGEVRAGVDLLLAAAAQGQRQDLQPAATS